MTTMRWQPFYVALELDPDDTDTSKWGNQRKVGSGFRLKTCRNGILTS